MSGEDVTATHISRQGTAKSKIWFDGSHNDLKNLVLTRLVPVLSSGHLAAVQHVNHCLPLTTQGGGGGGEIHVSSSHHTGDWSM